MNAGKNFPNNLFAVFVSLIVMAAMIIWGLSSLAAVIAGMINQFVDLPKVETASFMMYGALSFCFWLFIACQLLPGRHDKKHDSIDSSP